MMSRVKWEATEQATKEVPIPSTVTITLTNGREVSCRAEYEKGHPGNPLTPEELDAKFVDCSRNKLSPEQVKQAVDQFNRLEGLPNVAPLFRLLGGYAG